MAPRGSDRGFILFTAIWLLVLAGSITSLLVLRSAGEAKLARQDAEALQSELQLSGAIHGAIADMLVRGGGSPLSQTPGGSSLMIDGRSISIRTVSEAGKLDLNTVNLPTLDAAMHGFGVDAYARARVTSGLLRMRQSGRLLHDWAAVSAALAPIGDARPRNCLEQAVTIYSGLVEPDRSQMSTSLAQSLARTDGSEGAGRLMGGAAIGMEARLPGGARLTAVLRVTGLRRQPYEIARWEWGRAAPSEC